MGTTPSSRPVSVALPGPWWTELTYEGTVECEVGMRVWVPLRNDMRMGLIVSVGAPGDFSGVIKPVAALMDEGCALSHGTAELLRWFGQTWFCGIGMAMKALLPKPFLDGDSLPPPALHDPSPSAPEDLFLYDVRDCAREERYAALLEESPEGTLILFPQHDLARRFWENLPKETRARGLLWPKSTAKKAWSAWISAQKGEVSFVVGAQAAAMAPLPSIRRIIVEDESSAAWQSVRAPLFHMRTLLAKRARLVGAQLVLGGRMPSSRVYLGGNADGEGARRGIPQKRLVYVDLWDSRQSQPEGVAHSLPLSDALQRETLAALSAGRWAFWILDRKGYAGEVACEECGTSLSCARCGTAMRWERRGLSCTVCGNRSSVPDKCPLCGGILLRGLKPGLEALLEPAKAAIRGRSVISLTEEWGSHRSIALRLEKEYPRGALVLGTRTLLGLCDLLRVGVVGWIDADFESRAAEYDARARAFSMFWESCWRGMEPDERRVVVQSRRPGKGWQLGLTAGWRFFWEEELRERRDMELPPVTPLIRLEMSRTDMRELLPQLEARRFQLWSPEEGTLWLRTRRLKELRELLAPAFDIKNSRKDFPKVSVRFD